MSSKIKEFLRGWSGSAFGTYNFTMNHRKQSEVFGKNLCAENVKIEINGANETVKVLCPSGKIETIPFKYFGA